MSSACGPEIATGCPDPDERVDAPRGRPVERVDDLLAGHLDLLPDEVGALAVDGDRPGHALEGDVRGLLHGQHGLELLRSTLGLHVPRDEVVHVLRGQLRPSEHDGRASHDRKDPAVHTHLHLISGARCTPEGNHVDERVSGTECRSQSGTSGHNCNRRGNAGTVLEVRASTARRRCSGSRRGRGPEPGSSRAGGGQATGTACRARRSSRRPRPRRSRTRRRGTRTSSTRPESPRNKRMVIETSGSPGRFNARQTIFRVDAPMITIVLCGPCRLIGSCERQP